MRGKGSVGLSVALSRLRGSSARPLPPGTAGVQLPAPFVCTVVAVVSTPPSSIAVGSTHRPCILAVKRSTDVFARNPAARACSSASRSAPPRW